MMLSMIDVYELEIIIANSMNIHVSSSIRMMDAKKLKTIITDHVYFHPRLLVITVPMVDVNELELAAESIENHGQPLFF